MPVVNVMGACFANPNGKMPCLFRQPHWRNAMLSLPHHVSLIVMAESFEKQNPLIITFKTDPVPEKVCKTDSLGSICRPARHKPIQSYLIWGWG